MEDQRRHILVIINPISGTGKKERIPRLIDTVVDHDRNDVSIIMTEYPGHAHELAKMAVENHFDIVVAVGAMALSTRWAVPCAAPAPPWPLCHVGRATAWHATCASR